MKFGLIGKSLVHSFSKNYFQEKFKAAGLAHQYENCELAHIEEFPQLLAADRWRGFNVTIPYKESILKFVDERSTACEAIGASNTLSIENDRIVAHNTDYLGFRSSLDKLDWQPSIGRALILGSGGAAKAVIYALRQMDFKVDQVSRRATEGQLTYPQAQSLLPHYDLVVNCTPLGTFPKVQELAPLRPEGNLDSKLFYDLIYNPEQTAWLRLAAEKGAQISNGRAMLIDQAEVAWQIWNQT